MTEAVPPRPFDDMEALAWLRAQPDGRVTASAAELGRHWGWNRMRTGRRLKAWEKAGLISLNAEAIIVTTFVTPAVTDVPPTVTEAVTATVMPGGRGTRRSISPVKLAALIVALALACVSAAFSIDGLTAIFAGALDRVVGVMFGIPTVDRPIGGKVFGGHGFDCQNRDQRQATQANTADALQGAANHGGYLFH